MSNKFFLSLGSQPLANNYQKKYNIKQTRYNLNLYFNTKTKLVSISKRIPSKKMFNNKYPYRSSMSHTMKKSFKTLSKEIKQKFNPKLLLEIGSNDGALISNFKKKKVIGIEPCSNLANITKQMGYRVFNYYWNIRTANFLLKKKIHPDLIYSANTITHISNLNEVFNSISRVLSKNGILIIEDPSLLECIKKVAYDQFYNEHIYVFSALALNNILKIFKFELFNIKEINTHGGSIRYYIKRTSNTKIKINKSVRKFINKEINFGLGRFETYKNFAKKAINSKYKLLKILRKLKKKKLI